MTTETQYPAGTKFVFTGENMFSGRKSENVGTIFTLQSYDDEFVYLKSDKGLVWTTTPRFLLKRANLYVG